MPVWPPGICDRKEIHGTFVLAAVASPNSCPVPGLSKTRNRASEALLWLQMHHRSPYVRISGRDPPDIQPSSTEPPTFRFREAKLTLKIADSRNTRGKVSVPQVRPFCGKTPRSHTLRFNMLFRRPTSEHPLKGLDLPHPTVERSVSGQLFRRPYAEQTARKIAPLPPNNSEQMASDISASPQDKESASTVKKAHFSPEINAAVGMAWMKGFAPAPGSHAPWRFYEPKPFPGPVQQPIVGTLP
ncbi:hypothetical protein CIRG_02076 [Coccidioides immitis RMSCC 2394]|uniref:Uncharacterized protein n=1 Tax=Coccidioides immitis RMSCC 2394 TaxID=404692 RepID=A0A0J7AX29_COCIT|nr:hypothetical protein CIRG_02076 [Coccidioides immitis RMSCC 2394]